MPSILCLMFLVFLSGNVFAQERVDAGLLRQRFEKALLSRDLELARNLLPQLEQSGWQLELSRAAVLDAPERAKSMIVLAENKDSGKWGITALVAGVSAVLEWEGRTHLLGFDPQEQPELRDYSDSVEAEGPPKASEEIRRLLDRYEAQLKSRQEQDKAGEHAKSLQEAAWMLRTARVVRVESGTLHLASGQGVPVPAPLAEEMTYRFIPWNLDEKCIHLYRLGAPKPVLQGKLGKGDHGRLLAAPPPGVYVVELISTETGWSRLSLVLISDLRLSSVLLPTHLVVMARRAGKLEPGVEIRLWIPSENGAKALKCGRTDDQGICRFALEEPILRRDLLLEGEKDAHLARCNIYGSYSEYVLNKPSLVHLQCDRPVYRPGELVQGRILAYRSIKDEQGVISQRAITKHAVVLDWTWTRGGEKQIRGWTDDRGVFSFSFRLPESAEMGGGGCRIWLGEKESHRKSAFVIAAYRRASLLLSLIGPERARVDAQGLAVGIVGRYASGLPAASLPIKVEGSLAGNEETIDARLDAQGKLTLPLAFHELELIRSGTLHLTATVQAPEGKAVQARHKIKLTGTDGSVQEDSQTGNTASMSFTFPSKLQPAGSKVPIRLSGKPGQTLLFVAARDRILWPRPSPSMQTARPG